MGEIDFERMLAPISVAVVTTVGIGIYRHFVEDRVPLVKRVLNAVGLGLFVFFGVWAALEAPELLLMGVGAFLLLNVGDALISTSSRLDAAPAHPHVWVEPLNDLRRSGWVHLGTWNLVLGGKRPELTIYERPHDRSRFIAIGTAARGGIAEVQSLLDDGHGYLITLNRRSRTIRPPWMLKQALVDEPFDALVRNHDEALHYLRVMGVTPAPFPEGDPLDTMRGEHRSLRRFVLDRWWLAAIWPLVNYLTPTRSKPLHEQSDVDRQLRRYQGSLSPGPSNPSPTTL